MPAQILSMLAQPIVLAASTNVASVADPYATRTVALDAGVYRIFLAPGSGTGTEEDPWELLSALKTKFDAATGGANPYEFTLTTSGFVKLTYSGSGTTTVTWSTGNVVRNLLGFTATLSAILTATATYHPTHCAYSEGRESDSGWIVQPGKQPCAVTRGGRVYARTDGARRVVRHVRFGPLPELWEHRDGTTGTGLDCSPALPDDTARWLAPSSTPGLAPPWSWNDLVQSSGGQRLGAALGTFQELLQTPGQYDAVYLHPDTISGDSEQGLSSDEFRLIRWQNTTLGLVARETQ